MTPKKRMLAALNCQQPEDEIPFWELEFRVVLLRIQIPTVNQSCR